MDRPACGPVPAMLRPVAAPADLRPWIEGAVIVHAPAGLGCSRFPARVGSQLVLRLSGTVRPLASGKPAAAAADPLPAAALIGPSVRPETFVHEGAVSAVGLILRPEAVAGWLGPIAAALVGRSVALDDLDGPAWADVLQAVQEAADDRRRLQILFDALRQRVRQHARQDEARRRALQLQQAAGLIPHDGTARGPGLGTRQLQRRFAQQFGLGPKQFQRLLRLRELLHGALRAGPAVRGRGADLAQAAGCFDQSHLARELRGLAGETLTELLRQARPGPDGAPGTHWPLALGAAVASEGVSALE